jgi:hypothetical protein
MKKLLRVSEYPGLLIRLTVGLVFLVIYGGGRGYVDFVRYGKGKN